MAIVITGAGGFVERALMGKLIERGDNLVALDSQGGGIPAGAHAAVQASPPSPAGSA